MKGGFSVCVFSRRCDRTSAIKQALRGICSSRLPVQCLLLLGTHALSTGSRSSIHTLFSGSFALLGGSPFFSLYTCLALLIKRVFYNFLGGTTEGVLFLKLSRHTTPLFLLSEKEITKGHLVPAVTTLVRYRRPLADLDYRTLLPSAGIIGQLQQQ